MDDFTLSPLSLFLQAGPVGKSVMVLLLGASIWCWLLIVESAVSAGAPVARAERPRERAAARGRRRRPARKRRACASTAKRVSERARASTEKMTRAQLSIC